MRFYNALSIVQANTVSLYLVGRIVWLKNIFQLLLIHTYTIVRNMKYIFTLQILFIAVTSYSQTVTGKVTNTEKQPIEFASVALYLLPDSTIVTGSVTMSISLDRMNEIHTQKNEEDENRTVEDLPENRSVKIENLCFK